MNDTQHAILKHLLAGPMTSTELFTALKREGHISKRIELYVAMHKIGDAVQSTKLHYKAQDGSLVQYSITPTGRVQVRTVRCPHCGAQVAVE